ncbi:MAG: hypothetical protein ACOYXC_18960 [Candidatus Rifleibacteriota bacterium]
MNAKKAFTLLEAVIISALTIMVFFFIQSFFSHTVKTSIKGQDNLDSIAAACKILSEMHKDLQEFEQIHMDVDQAEISTEDESIDPDTTYATILFIEKRDHGITYGLNEQGGTAMIEKSSITRKEIRQKSIGGARIKSFDLLNVINENSSFAGMDTYGQVAINLLVQSDNPNFPSKKIEISTAFFPEMLQESDWNPLK